MILHRLTSATATTLLLLGLGVPAMANAAPGSHTSLRPTVGAQAGPAIVQPNEPPASCGSRVIVSRSGTNVRVTGMSGIIPRGRYGLVYTYEQNGTAHGGYNASSSGFGFNFTAGKSSTQTFTVAVFNETETYEYCNGNYTK